jgi:hypothetical protein
VALPVELAPRVRRAQVEPVRAVPRLGVPLLEAPLVARRAERARLAEPLAASPGALGGALLSPQPARPLSLRRLIQFRYRPQQRQFAPLTRTTPQPNASRGPGQD